MKKVITKIYIILFTLLLSAGCSDFEEINDRPDQFPSDEVSAKFFLTGLQIELYAPNRYPYWRAQLIHADRYAGQFTFGFNGCWWNDGLCYTYDIGYTDAAYDWIAGYIVKLSAYMNFVQEGGELENDKYYAIGLIMKGMYYQMYTDIFGMVSYSEALNPDIITPKYDSQAEIYAGVIAELDEAMTIIGDAADTGQGVELLAENDLFFNGDLQQWKKLANSLKLRMGLRAQGAPGASFAESAITTALQNELLTTSGDNVLMEKDTEIDQFQNAAYGDVWYNFDVGSNWTVGKTLIDNLRNNNDPRLFKYAQPIDGGEVVFTKPSAGQGAALFDKHVAFIMEQLDDAGVPYTRVDGDGTITVTITEGTYYVGQPTRLNADIYTHVKEALFCRPAEIIINPKNQGLPIFSEIVFTAAEGNFLQAEAIVKGLASGDAQSLYQEGIRQAMLVWEVDPAEIENFLATEEMALLNGSTTENLEKIATQRWIAAYTDGFEAWAIVRDSGYPSELYQGVSDYDIYSAGTLNGAYPQRMRYGTGAYNTNGANTEMANQAQGPDEQRTKLWWAK
ncbi:Starch-binding associating with outer membrane [Sinomicrobium oceani]|uniref:Starch-binding associating with outer membrane n=1 Tax=Sinomicrobium oceani TaxID=1150368 RepID=A0A1K1R9M7_9FLAO|nr:SusD/RagB family nutrient-binding outer membrane lipoprotein [Sinomicrobium oceani]SFW68784.1 Starch-binding associating with outer membrane [Sinomicrobium oceani]